MNYVTYAHYKPDGTMFYIGKGSIKRAHTSVGRNVVWERTVEKHGGFNVEILANWSTEKEAFEHEVFLIDTIKSMGIPLVNMAKGGLGSTGFRHTEKYKADLALKMKTNNPMSNPEFRKKQSIAIKEAMNRPEIRLRQRNARVGKKLSEFHVESLKNCHPMKPCVINGVEYKSLMEASRSINVRHGTLYRWLNNPDVTHNKKYSHIIECRWV